MITLEFHDIMEGGLLGEIISQNKQLLNFNLHL